MDSAFAAHSEKLAAHDGVQLFLRASGPGEVKANALLTHGRGEHSGRYAHVAKALAARGIRLWGYDLRGHGRSGGKRGDLPSYAALLDDLDLVAKRVGEEREPLFLLGHSLGGQITLNYVLDRKPACRGVAVTSPYLRLAFVPEWWRVASAELISKVWPSFTQFAPMHWTRLSRDREHLESLPETDLMHWRISVRMYHAIKKGAADALARAGEFRAPLLLIHGADDPITSVEATREFYDLAGSTDKTLTVFPEMLHETHNELGRDRVIASVADWILARCGGEK